MKTMKFNRIGWVAFGVALVGVGVGIGIATAQTGSPTAQQPPRQFPYQGYLEDATGPLNAARDMSFFITNSATATVSPCTAPACRWSETIAGVNVSQGYFSVALGKVTPFPDNLFESNTLYLRVQVGAELLDGGQQLLATPHAITAQVAQTFRVQTLKVDGGASMANATVTGAASMGSASVGGSISVGGNEDVTGTLNVTGATTMSSSSVTGNASVGGNLTVTGGGSISGALRYPFTVTQSAAVTGGAAVVLRSKDNSVCWLSDVSFPDTIGVGPNNRCLVAISGNNWVIDVSDFPIAGESISCRATCLAW